MIYIKKIISDSAKIIFHKEKPLRPQLIDISIIIPLKDEAGSIKELKDRINQAMNTRPWSWECIWIDDGSTDHSLPILKELCQRDAHHHRYLSFEHNAGQSAALWAGFKESKGSILATLDGDLQNDPADIPYLANVLYSQGVDMVNGYRKKREDNLVRKIASKIGNSARTWITGKTIRDVGCSTRVFKRECVRFLPLFAGMHRFFPTLVAMQGYKLIEVPVNHGPRLYGRTKYSINSRLWVGIIDILGVLWLQKRAFHYRIIKKS
ncbi:MAG: glycosyltransferase family 2 protein [bacterium]